MNETPRMNALEAAIVPDGIEGVVEKGYQALTLLDLLEVAARAIAEENTGDRHMVTAIAAIANTTEMVRERVFAMHCALEGFEAEARRR